MELQELGTEFTRALQSDDPSEGINAAARLMASGAYSKAIRAYQQIAEAHPEEMALCEWQVGAALESMGEHDWALYFFQAALCDGADEDTLLAAVSNTRARLDAAKSFDTPRALGDRLKGVIRVGRFGINPIHLIGGLAAAVLLCLSMMGRATEQKPTNHNVSETRPTVDREAETPTQTHVLKGKRVTVAASPKSPEEKASLHVQGGPARRSGGSTGRASR